MPAPAWVKDRDTLRELVNLVVVYAPDFPEEDYLAPEEQLTLERAFGEIRAGLRFVPGLLDDQARHGRTLDILERTEDAYRRGERRDGNVCMMMLEDEWFGST